MRFGRPVPKARCILVAALLALASAAAADAQPTIDFSSTAGLDRTCRQMSAVERRKLGRGKEKIAFALCTGTALLRDGAQWMRETDDDTEWIPNPKQVNTSFPLAMDAQTFATWGALLDHMGKLFRGETLLGGGALSREFPAVRDLTLGLCKPGEGINLRGLFLEPIRRPLDSGQWRARCVAAGAGIPLSGLAHLIQESIQRNAGRGAEDVSGEWMILRHLYWVN